MCHEWCVLPSSSLMVVAGLVTLSPFGGLGSGTGGGSAATHVGSVPFMSSLLTELSSWGEGAGSEGWEVNEQTDEYQEKYHHRTTERGRHERFLSWTNTDLLLDTRWTMIKLLSSSTALKWRGDEPTVFSYSKAKHLLVQVQVEASAKESMLSQTTTAVNVAFNAQKDAAIKDICWI